MRHFLLGCLWITLCISEYREVQAQDSSAGTKSISKFEVNKGGVPFYRPQKWGVARISVRNLSTTELNLLASTHFAEDATLQYGRRIWAPPKSVINSWHLIKMPEAKADQKFFELRTLVMTRDGDVETLAKSDMGAMQFDQGFQIADAKQVTVAIIPAGMQESRKSLWSNSADFLRTARNDRGMNTNLADAMHEPLLPATEEAWDVVDHLIIADDRISDDLAGISSIRRWVAGGGSMWIMADKVSPELLEKLIGDEAAISVVDRVELTHVSLIKAVGAESFPPYERDLDRPAPMVRIVAENIEPAFYADGWPAAFWKSYGEGRILVTTLGSDGWLRPRKPEDPVSNAGVLHQSIFIGGDPLNNLSAGFFVPKSRTAFNQEIVEDQVRETIGYSIPSRNIILGTLLGFTGVLAICAVWLSRSGSLEWLGAATPVAALISAGILASTGVYYHSAVPSSTSVIQLAQAVPGTDDVRLTGVAGIYNGGGETKGEISGQRGGLVVPDMSGLEGMTRRLVWTDTDRWSWENITQKPGMRLASTETSIPVPLAMAAEARIDTNGLSGRVLLPEGMQLSDAILATPTGRIALNVTNDGNWTADQNSTLLPGQFIKASILGDEQQRRTRILTELLKAQPNKRVPAVPMVYGWTKAWDTGFNYGQDAPVNGSSLVAIPISWTAGAPDQECTLPSPLLTFQEVTGPDGNRQGGFYDSRNNKWQEKSGESASWIAFELPRRIMPVTLKRAEITIKVKGAVGRLQISGFKDGQVQPIQTWESPVGTLTYTIEDGSLIPLDANGRFNIRIDAGLSNLAEYSKGSATSGEGATTTDGNGANAPVPAAPSLTNPTTYWQFEEISARITVVTPPSDRPSQPTP